MTTDRTSELTEVFKAAWHAADGRGEAGSRTRAGISAVLAALEDTRPPLERLNAAMSEFANALAGRPVLVDVGLVVWEQVVYEDGEIGRATKYAVPTDNFSLSSVLGLLEASREYVRRDILGERGAGGDDDD